MSEEKKDETIVGTAMKNGGGAVVGGALGAAVVAPLAVWGIGLALAPFTGGLSAAAAAAITAGAVVGGAVIGHKKSKELD